MKKVVAALVVIAMIAIMAPAAFATTESAGFMLEGGTPYEWTAEYTGVATLSGEPAVNIMVNEGSLGMGTSPSFEVTAGTTYTVQHFGEGFAWITWSIEVADGGEGGGSDLAENQVAIESYGFGEFTAPETGTLKLTLDADAQMDVVVGYSLLATINSGETVEVEAGTTYYVYPINLSVDSILTWEYVEGGETTAPEKQLVDLTGTVVGACSTNSATAGSYSEFTWWSDGRPDWKPLGNFVDNNLDTTFNFGAGSGERADLYLDLSNGGTGSTAVGEFVIYHSSTGDVPSLMVVLVLEDGTEWTKTYETNWVQFGGHASIVETFTENKNAVGMYIWQNGSSGAYFGDIEIYEYVTTGDDTTGDDTVPSGSALALGDNNVTLAYATMPMAAPYWTYTATETGSLTVTVSSIDGNSMLDMAFGRGMYTLLVGETDGAYTNTATVAMGAGESVNIAVLNSVGEAPAVITLSWTAGEGGEGGGEGGGETTPDGTSGNPYVIDALPYTINFYGGMDEYYVYTAATDGTIIVTALEGGILSLPNGEAWDYDENGNYAIPVTAGYELVLNPWTMSPAIDGSMVVNYQGGGEGGGSETPSENTIEIESYGNAEWTAPEDGYVKFTINIPGATLAVLNGFSPLAEGADSVTVQVTAGTTYGIYPGYDVTTDSVVTWEYVEGGEGGGEQVEGLPSGSALALGDNNVTLTYATMPMMAPYWTYTATEAGYLTVTVSSINGNTMLGMPFGMGNYTLLVGDTDGAYTNTATVYMNVGDTVNVAVLDTMDMEAVPAVLNVSFEAGEPVVEKNPADYFDTDPETGYYVIGSLESPVDIFVGNDDINYIYTVETDGVLSVEPSDPVMGGNIWYIVNGVNNYSIAPESVSAGDEVVLNIWSGFEGTVTLTAGEGGGEGGEDVEPGESITVENGEGTISEIDAIEIFYTPDADGVLTVDLTADPGFKFWVFEAATDASLTLPESGTSGTYTYNLVGGTEYRVYIIGYYEYAEAAAVINYDVSFAAQEVEQPTVDIDKSDVVLELGDNNVVLLENTIVSLFEFVPAEPGIYTITVGDGVTMSTYTFTQYLIEEAVDGVIEHTATAAEQTVLIGLSAETASVTVTIEKTGDYTPPAQTVYEDYTPSNTVEPDFEEPTDLESIDITQEQNVVLGDDGYYHLGTADGPIIYVNLNNEQFTLAVLYDAGAPITMRGTYVDENGEEHPYDFMDMITGLYYDYSQVNDYHPLNTDLMIFLKAYGEAQGWYNANTSGFASIANGEFNEESAWLASCYVSAAELEGGNDDTTGDDTTGDDTTGDDTTGDDTTGDDTTGDDTTGDDTTGDDTTGDGTTGDGTTGDDTTGDDTTGDDTTGDDTTGDDTTDDDDVPADTGSIGIIGAIVAMAFSAIGGAAVVVKKKEF